MRLFAIFGNPVSHSHSPLMHNYVFKKLGYSACYTRIELNDGSKLRETFLNLGLSGANVTVPHKEAAFLACDEIRGFAQAVGVVNTIVLQDGKMIGYNTDADGFLYLLEGTSLYKRVLILGAGGTARALSLRLIQAGYIVNLTNRSSGRFVDFDGSVVCKTWDELEDFKYDIVINTTSAGLKDDDLPAPQELLERLLLDSACAIDVIYGKETPFLKLAKSLEKTTIDGADMLLGQGVLANELFVESMFDKESILRHMKQSFLF